MRALFIQGIRMRFKLLPVLAATILLAGDAAAYNVFPFGNDQALKWGSNDLGTPGGVITWSLIPNGTALDPLVAGFNWSGTSDLASVDAQVGGQIATLAAIQAALDAWSAAADIQFVRVEESGGLALGAATAGTAVVGQIRIGAFAFAPGDFTGAVGYAPPPNGGTTLEGDVIFNINNRFGIPAGAEGDPFNLFPPPTFFYLNDLAGLVAHELGHALGLGHSDVTTSLMCGYVDTAFNGSQCHWADPDGNNQAPITRQPKADDVAGIQHLYGVPEPATGAAYAAGLALLVAFHRRRRTAGGSPRHPGRNTLPQ